MLVAGVQFDLAWEDPAESFRRAAPLLERAAGAGAQLVALPEMFATGFSMDAAAVARHADATKAWLQEQAQRLRLQQRQVGILRAPSRVRPPPILGEELCFRERHSQPDDSSARRKMLHLSGYGLQKMLLILQRDSQ
jgi:predicted amidohydrolase